MTTDTSPAPSGPGIGVVRNPLAGRRGQRTLSALPLAERVGTNLARLRQGAQLTVKRLAQRSGLHWRHVQRLERGKANATLSSIAALASALDVDAGQFFTPLHLVAAQARQVGATVARIQIPDDTMTRLDALRTRIGKEPEGRSVDRPALMRALLQEAIDAAERRENLAGLLVADPVRRGRPRGTVKRGRAHGAKGCAS